MKKIFVVLACVAMLFSFASCDNNSGSSANLNRVAMAADAMTQLNAAISKIAADADFVYDQDNITSKVEYVDNTHANIVITIAEPTTPSGSSYIEGTVTIALTGDAFKDKETSHETTLKEAVISTNLTLTDAVYNQYSFSVNGKVSVDGKLTITAPVAASQGVAEKAGSAAIAGATAVSFSDTVAISADGGVDTKAVFERADITSTEAAEAAAQKAAEAKVKEFVAAIQTGLGSSSAYAINSEKTGITVTAANVIDTDKAAVMTLTGTVGGTTGAYTLNVTKATIGKIEDVTDYGTLDFSQATVTVTVAQGESIGLTTDDGTIAGATAAAKPTSGLTVTVTGTVKLGDYSVQIAATSAN